MQSKSPNPHPNPSSTCDFMLFLDFCFLTYELQLIKDKINPVYIKANFFYHAEQYDNVTIFDGRGANAAGSTLYYISSYRESHRFHTKQVLIYSRIREKK